MGETARMTRKGILYTLGLTLFALALLGIALLFLKQEQSTRFMELGSRQNIHDLERSIHNAFVEVVKKEGFRMSTTINSFTVNSSLPYNVTKMINSFALIEQSVERDFLFISIDNQSFLAQNRFVFMPSQIRSTLSKPTEVIIEPENDLAAAIVGYNVSLTALGDITCTNKVDGGGSLTVQVSASSLDEDCTIDATELVKKLTLDITSSQGTARLEISSDDTKAELKLKSDVPLSSSITVLVQPLAESGSVVLPMNLTVNHSALSYYKSAMIPLFS